MSLQSSFQAAFAQASVSSWPSLTFGKHKGKPIDQVESGYLEWALKNAKLLDSKPFIKAEIERLLRERGRGQAAPLPTPDEPLNNTESEARLLETIGQLRGDLNRARVNQQRAEDRAEKLERQLWTKNLGRTPGL